MKGQDRSCHSGQTKTVCTAKMLYVAISCGRFHYFFGTVFNYLTNFIYNIWGGEAWACAHTLHSLSQHVTCRITVNLADCHGSRRPLWRHNTSFCDRPDNRRELLDIRICKTTPTTPPVPVSTICPWAFLAISEKALFLLERGQGSCLKLVFLRREREKFLWRYCCNLGRAIGFVLLSTSPRQPRCPSAHRAPTREIAF